MPRWSPAKPKGRIKVIECGAGYWGEQDHGLDIPHGIHTVDFKITGTGHERIARIFDVAGLNEKQPEHRIAAWLCEHACSFVLFDTKARATVIGFEREDDADAFRREFVEQTARSQIGNRNSPRVDRRP